MEKDFIGWHIVKERIHNQINGSIRGYKEREVWWLSLGHNVGDEEDGKGGRFSRPIFVVKGFNRHIFWGVPLTSVEKEGQYYHAFRLSGSYKISTALLSQMRVFDTKRMTLKMGMASVSDFNAIKKKLSEFLF